MKKTALLSLFLFMLSFCFGQEKMEYFLPDDVTYNKNIPTPEEFFSQEVGEWNLTYEQVLYYIKEIASCSDRAIMYEYARSWENRPLVHIVFTSEKNQSKLDELKQLHYDYSELDKDISKEGVPAVIILGYGVHGNESSATNSSVLTAYYLAAAEGAKIDELLEKTIVIVDPCLNPDGFTRHSTWANMHQSFAANGDNNSRQFSEVWPGGRTNHYWFDINRDYLMLVHPESKGRVERFHEWKPNIVTDHHEMGSNSSFFFQPGVPSRNNPLTPEKNYELTHEIAQYHAKFLDAIGSTYFSEEQYDDYYYGKASAYPDVNASIGILFEQARFQGRIKQTDNGMKKLAFGIRNQFTTSLSTMEAAVKMHDKLLLLQKDFYQTANEVADNCPTKAYVFGSEYDKVKTQMFIDLLNRHQINVYENTSDLTADNITFKAGTSYIVPIKQKQVRLIESIFEDVHSFTDTTFYDVSTWTFTHAYNIPVAGLSSLKNVSTSEDPVEAQNLAGKIIGGKSGVGYVFRWNEYNVPEALYKLQDAGLITKVATEKFSYKMDGADENFGYGTIFIPANDQNRSPEGVYQLIEQTAKSTGIDFYALSTGLSPNGIDMGSGSFANLTKPKMLMFIGGSASISEAGEIWHLFDQRYHIPITLADLDKIGSINLAQYNNIILTGSLREWNSNNIEKLKTWVKDGGNLVVCKNAAVWAAKNKLGSITFKKPVAPDTTRYLTYAERSKERSLNYISGAIFESDIDITHPLCYGYTDNKLAIFKNDITVANSLEKKYIEPVKYSQQPYLSGWVSEDNINRLKGAPIVSVQNIGRGKLISYLDDMSFRGMWLGTNKLFSNSVFFGPIIR